MALNGLDLPDVAEAFDALSNGTDNWLLLHYISRDEVALLARSDDGLVGLRSNIIDYHGSSALYGALVWQDQRVLLKYCPQGISRLMLARTAVHFQMICHHYPHDLVLDAGSPDDLTDIHLATMFSTARPDLVTNPSSVQRPSHRHQSFHGPLNSHRTNSEGDPPLSAAQSIMTRPSMTWTPHDHVVDTKTDHSTIGQVTNPDRGFYTNMAARPRHKLFPRPLDALQPQVAAPGALRQKMPAGTRASWAVRPAEQKASKSRSSKPSTDSALRKSGRSKTTEIDAARSDSASKMTPRTSPKERSSTLLQSVDARVHVPASAPSPLVSMPSIFSLPPQQKPMPRPSPSQLLEKERLMMALRLRRRQIAAGARQQANLTQINPAHQRDVSGDKADSGVGLESENEGADADNLLQMHPVYETNKTIPSMRGFCSQPEFEETSTAEAELGSQEVESSSSPHVNNSTAATTPYPSTMRAQLRIRTHDAEKRKGYVEPWRKSFDPSELDSADGDSLLEELRTAEVQQATPVSISLSPVTAVFPASSGAQKIGHDTSPLSRRNGTYFPLDDTAHLRETGQGKDLERDEHSAGDPHESSQPPPIRTRRRSQERAYREALGADSLPLRAATTKHNLSLGISRRIQTLVDVSRRPPKRNVDPSFTDLEMFGPFLVTRDDSVRSRPITTLDSETRRPATHDGPNPATSSKTASDLARPRRAMSYMYDGKSPLILTTNHAVQEPKKSSMSAIPNQEQPPHRATIIPLSSEQRRRSEFSYVETNPSAQLRQAESSGTFVDARKLTEAGAEPSATMKHNLAKDGNEDPRARRHTLRSSLNLSPASTPGRPMSMTSRLRKRFSAMSGMSKNSAV